MELLILIVLVSLFALCMSSLLHNQKKAIQSSKTIEKKLDKVIELLDKASTKE